MCNKKNPIYHYILHDFRYIYEQNLTILLSYYLCLFNSTTPFKMDTHTVGPEIVCGERTEEDLRTIVTVWT